MATVFNDGQIHLAKWIREALNINDGDELSFDIGENNTIVFKKMEE